MAASHRPPVLRMLACTVRMVAEIAIILGNAPRSRRESGRVVSAPVRFPTEVIRRRPAE
jgi:hypothetical protein